MKSFSRLNWFQWLIIFFIFFISFRNLIFFDFEIPGKYVSNADRPTLEMPGKGAELYLYKDGTYSSNSMMGEGTYELKGASIKLSKEYQSWGFPLQRRFNIGKPMMVINYDAQFYFIKE